MFSVNICIYLDIYVYECRGGKHPGSGDVENAGGEVFEAILVEDALASSINIKCM